MANKFNIYFSQIGNKLASKIQTGCRENLKTSSSHSMYLNLTDITEIKQLVLELKNNKAPGPDGITNEILKLTINYIAEPLCHIFNRCIERGEFPNHFKVAKVRPLFKGGDKCNIANYRPISLTSSIGKLFEKILKLRLANYLDKNGRR